MYHIDKNNVTNPLLFITDSISVLLSERISLEVLTKIRQRSHSFALL